MAITTMSSRDFNQDTSGAKRAANQGPVFVTDRGTVTHVLLTIEEYRKLTGRPMSLAEAVGHPESADIEFDVPRIDIVTKPAPLE